MFVDFRKHARQIPGGEILSRRCGSGGPLHEAPSVLLEILPVPVCQQRLQDWAHFLGRFGNLGFEPGDLLLGFVALDIAFQRDLLTDGFHGLRISLVFHRGGNDGFEVGDGGLRQSFVDGVLDFFPLCVARTGEQVQAHKEED